jgi:hypothetical protein
MNDDLRTQLYNLMYELDTRAPKVWSSLVNAWLSEVTFFQEVDDEWLVTDDATDEQVEMLIAEVRDALDNLDDEYPTCRRCGEGMAAYKDGRTMCENPECELHGWDSLTRTCYDCYRSDVVLKELTVYGWYDYYDENTRTNEEVRTSEDVGICKDCYVDRNGTYEDWNALPPMYVAPEHTRYGTLPPWDKES